MNQVEQKKSVPPKKQKPKLKGRLIPQSQASVTQFNHTTTARTQKVTKSTLDDAYSDINPNFNVGATRYNVQSGDTLSRIAKNTFSDASHHHAIFNANMDNLPEPSISDALTHSEDMKDREDYKIYKKLKSEVGEFYPYPGLWLEAPHELLSGRTPLEIALTSPQGAEIVYDLIASIKAGHFS